MESNAGKRVRFLRRHAGKIGIGVLVAWVLVMTSAQEGPHALLVLGGLIVSATAVLIILRRMAKHPFWIFWNCVFLSLTLMTVIWFYVTGSYRSLSTCLLDIATIAGGGCLGYVLIRSAFRLTARSPSTHPPRSLMASAMLVMGWISISLITLFREHPLPIDPSRFSRINSKSSIVADDSGRWGSLRVGLALSGGGYRAAIFHAGTLHALESLGIRVNAISTVSGGSIFGSFYAIGGSPETFRDAVMAGRFNLKRQLTLVHNAIRLPFPLTIPGLDVTLFPWYRFSRLDVQAQMLERTLLGTDESRRSRLPDDSPSIVIVTTDLTFGQQVGLTTDGAVVIDTGHIAEAYRYDAWSPNHRLTYAQRVALSGAFPVAFPAEAIGVTAIPLGGSGTGERPLRLSDGGIFDNTGLLMLKAVDSLACRDATCEEGGVLERHSTDRRMASDVFFVSDAGAVFGVEPALNTLGEALRATDVSASLTNKSDAPSDRARVVRFSAQEHFLPSSKLFRMYDGTKRRDRREQATFVSFDPKCIYPDDVVEALVRLLSPGDKARGLTQLAQYRKVSGTPVDLQEWRKELPRQKSGLPCAPRENLPGFCEASEIRYLVQNAIKTWLIQFQDTSTLEDLPTPQQVNDLYLLGNALVLLQWPQIREAMNATLTTSILQSPRCTLGGKDLLN